MTADAFGRLLYTDCRAGTGRGSGGGFQIQAQSAGVDAAQARMAVSWLLYEAQNAYIVQRRPVEDFPPGFAHACYAGYGTAQGRYVGKEATGGRQGNHLTDCLLTRDPDLYGSVRPAQLWCSELWRTQPWDTPDCPPFAGDLSPGPLTVDAVTDWLKDRKERGPVLARLLSVLEDQSGRRVVIVAAEAGEAMRWVAAVTLLLPTRRALEVSFKVFSSNPLRAEHRIVAVPRELNAQLAPARSDSLLVLDAEGCAMDEIETTERAGFLVDHLLSVDDPYDVIDAVELAESLGGGLERDGMNATLTAWALTRPADLLLEPLALARWLSQAGAALQREYGPTVAGMILAADPSADVLRWLDQSLARGVMEFDAGPVRIQLLGAELAEAREEKPVPADELAAVDLGFDARRDAESELSSAILLGTDAQVNLLLRLARRHGVQPELTAAPMRRRIEDFVGNWIDHGLRYDPGQWVHCEQILDSTQEALRARLHEGGLAAVRPALERLFRYFADRIGDPSDPLDRHLAAAAIAARPVRERSAQLRTMLDLLLSSPSLEVSAVALQQALIDWSALGPAEAELLISHLPEQIRILPEVVTVAVTQLEAEEVSEHTLEILASLDRRRVTIRSSSLAGLLAADRDIRAFLEATRTNEFVVDQRYFDGMTARLGRADPEVLKLRLGSVLRACLECRHPYLGSEVLSVLEARKLRPSPGRLLLDGWQQELGGPGTIDALVWGVRCLRDPDLASKRREQLTGAIRTFRESLSRDGREALYQQVQQRLQPDEREIWAEVAAQNTGKSRINLWKSRDGGQS
jgi:GTPase-associated protein 1, N-terminal domain type 2/GTPase-associated protein 1, middle domain